MNALVITVAVTRMQLVPTAMDRSPVHVIWDILAVVLVALILMNALLVRITVTPMQHALIQRVHLVVLA